MPYFLEAPYKYSPYIPTDPSQFISSLFLPEVKSKTILLTFASFGFLPILSFASLPLIFENFIERFVLNTAGTRWDLGFHYNAVLSPIMLVASLEAIYTLKLLRWKKILFIWSFMTVCLVIFLHRFYLHGPLLLATNPVFYEDTKKAEFLRKFIEKIPRKGLLMTQNNIASHFTHDRVFLLNEDFEKIKPDYIAIDIRPGQNRNNFFPLHNSFNKFVAEVSTNSSYTQKKISDTQLLFIKR